MSDACELDLDAHVSTIVCLQAHTEHSRHGFREVNTEPLNFVVGIGSVVMPHITIIDTHIRVRESNAAAFSAGRLGVLCRFIAASVQKPAA